MAIIRSFRGIRYNPRKVTDLSQVVAQPYDRIGKTQQAAYYQQHPNNIVRIDYGQSEPDEPNNNVYTRAREYAQAWLAEGVLSRDDHAVLYALEQTFATPDGQTRTRRAFTAALQVTPFEEGVILPHERTFSGPKSDRLNLTRATQTAWGHIFILYPDSENRINTLLQPYLERHDPVPARELVIEPAVEQRFWAVDDAALIEAITAEMQPKRNLVIADGHHRYETALNYRAEMRDQHPNAPAAAAFNFTLATFVSMSDPGLVILPTHRLVRGANVPGTVTGAALLAGLADGFEVARCGSRAAMEALLRQATPEHPRFGFYDGSFATLTLRTLEAMAQLAPEHVPAWRALDVAVLHKMVLERVMGLSTSSGHDADHVSYLRDVNAGYAAVDQGEADCLFVLNATRMEQVNACTQAGEKMPQKSTDFYPKMIGGLVALSLTGKIGE
ncbi:MAG: DUF1015 domain-containing protein [Chloroflexi bacterium]|nr:DUF1015 domain-containing protein [Chloroflexota bacterium]